jgi:hypothetical protein
VSVRLLKLIRKAEAFVVSLVDKLYFFFFSTFAGPPNSHSLRCFGRAEQWIPDGNLSACDGDAIIWMRK